MVAKHQQHQMFRLATFTVFVLLHIISCKADTTTTSTRQVIERGFTERHDPSYTEFQPLLSDPTGIFSLGFFRVNSTLLDLAVIHLPSSFPVWSAVGNTTALSSWTGTAFLSFNGSLMLLDNSSSQPKLLWSTNNLDAGDQLLLLNTSNLRIQKQQSVMWQSFDFPSDTLVLSQNFKSSAALLSRNHNFSMRLGSNYLALYMEQGLELTKRTSNSIIYWKHTALQAKAQIVEGGGEIYACVKDGGFLGMYQSSQNLPVDVLAFNSFNRGISKFRRLTLENDGNLRAYYWNTTNWLLDYVAIPEPCGLPTVCGVYGLCFISEQSCGCLLSSNNTSSEDSQQEQCSSAAAVAMGPGNDLCEQGKGKYQVVRRQGVDLSIEKELVSYQKVATMTDCEATCENNCSCWGAVYNNATGFCYLIDYPIQTLVDADQRKFAYLKVMTTVNSSSSNNQGHKAKLVFLVLAIGILIGCAVFGVFRVRQCRRQQQDNENDDQASSLPYKNLSSASFRSIELCNTNKINQPSKQ